MLNKKENKGKEVKIIEFKNKKKNYIFQKIKKCKIKLNGKISRKLEEFKKRKEEKNLDKENPYFLDFPVEDIKYDCIGFNSYVDGLYKNIMDDAKMIGLVADYGSGKSTVVNLLEKKLYKALNRRLKKKCKIAKINLWDSINGSKEQSDFEIHKRFLFQLSTQLNDNLIGFLSKKLNPNYSVLNISTKNKRSGLMLGFTLFCYLISVLNKAGILATFNFLPVLGWDKYTILFKIFANFSGFVGLIFTVLLLLSNEVIFSYFKSEKDRNITENDSIEIYLDLIKKYNKKKYNNKKLIIVIEDLDRIDKKNVKGFLNQIYTFYSHSGNKNITFIVAIRPDDYYKSIKTNYKVFDYIVDLQELKLKDYEHILFNLLESKSKVLDKKFSIKINEKEKGKWMWLAQGQSLDIRQLKHRYNDVVLQFSTLIERFPTADISINSCIAVNYLRNEYPIFYQELIKQEAFSDEYNYSDIRKLVNSFLKNNQISDDEMWKDYQNKYLEIGLKNYQGIDSELQLQEKAVNKNFNFFKKDVYKLIQNFYINENLELYFYNYPKGNIIFSFEENIFKDSYLYDINRDDIIDIVDYVLNRNTDFILTIKKKRKDLDLKYPKMIFDYDRIFSEIYTSSDEEEKEYIYIEMLNLSSQNSEITIKRLNIVKQSDVYDEYFVDEYISHIEESFRTENDDTQLVNIRFELLKIFSEYRDYLTTLFFDSFPIISKKELESFEDLIEAIDYISFDNIDEKNIAYIINYINEKYSSSDFDTLCSFLDMIQKNLIIDVYDNLEVFEKFNDNDKIKFKIKYFDMLGFNDAFSIISFIKKIGLSFEDLEIKLSQMFEGNLLDKNIYCKFINTTGTISNITLKYISDKDIEFAFNEVLQNRFYENGYYLSYVKSKILTVGSFEIEREKVFNLKEAYIKLYEDASGNFEEYIINSNSAMEYYKEIELYKKYGESGLMPFSYIANNYDMLKCVINKIDDINILNEYLSNIPKIEISEEDGKELIENYVNKLVLISDEANEHFKSLLPSTSLIRKLNAYRQWRGEKILQTN
jgi:hypothetical protein